MKIHDFLQNVILHITEDDALAEHAKIRCRCSCLEEYLIERDLKLGMSKLEQMLDFIAIVEKHPRLCFCLDMQNGHVSLFTNILASMLTFFMMAFAKVFFPYAYIDDNMFVATFIFDFIGIALIILALSIKVSDAKYALKINKLLRNCC